VAGGLTLALPVGDLIDPAVEGARLRKEIAKLDGTLRALSYKLENKGFLDSAPAEVVAETRERLATETARRARLAEALAAIGA
jgi:valyl-tRNA synthetase